MATGSEMLLASVRRATEGEYTVDHELGRGGMAAVYLARDIQLDRLVAIKVMLPDLVDVSEMADRFVIEARAAARLDHPGIVTVYSVKKREELLFIVMKYIAGRTLEAVLRDQREVPVNAAAAIVSQVAEALQFAHAEGVVHRDVKPSNVLIDTRGRPVIADFGIAKVTAATSITVTGALIGTPAYMSPEQCRGLPATTASDQYSLGIMAYELMARRLPFTGSLFELIHAHGDDAPEPLSTHCPGIDPQIEEAVMRMLAKSPRDRFPNLGDVAHVFARDTSHSRGGTQARDAIAQLAREEPQQRPLHRKAVGYDLSGQSTEQVTTPAPGLVITPHDLSIEIGATVSLRVSESSGASLAGVRIEWRSEDPSVATVDATGAVTGTGVGLAKISASGGMALGRAMVTVKATEVNTLVVTPQNPEIEADNEMQLIVTALDARGNVMPRQSVVWVSSDVATCAVSQQGRVIGVSPGRATLTAQIGDVSGSTAVRVRAQAVARIVVTPGELGIETEEHHQLAAAVFNHLDRPLKGRDVTWRSSVPAVATVDGDGTVVGVEPGTAAIIASCDGKEGICSLIVRSQPIVAVRIQPARLQLELGRSLQLQGVAEDRKGRAVSDRWLEWHSDENRIALIDANGKVHAASVGRTTVHAVVDGVESSIEVMVVPRPTARVQIAAHQASMVVGARAQLDAAIFDAEGNLLKDRGVEWSTTDSKVVTIDATGLLVANRAGSARITASSGVVRATTPITVSVAKVAAPASPIAPTAPMRAGVSARELAANERDAPSVSDEMRPSRRRHVIAGAVGVAMLVTGGWFGLKFFGTSSPVAPMPSDPALPTASPVSGGVSTNQLPDQLGRANAGAESSNRVTNPTATDPVRERASVAPRDSKAFAATPSAGTDTKRAQPDSKQIPPPPVASPLAANPSPGSATTNADPASGRGASVTNAPPPQPEPVTKLDPIQTTNAPSAGAGRSGAVNVPVGAAATGAADGAERAANRMLLCESPVSAATAVNSQIATDPAKQLAALYRPRDGTDRAALDAMNSLFKDAQRLRAIARTVRNETNGDVCEWVVAIDLQWTNAFGQPRRRSVQMRAELEAVGGAAKVKRLFGATGF